MQEQDSETIRAIVEQKAQRFRPRGGAVAFAGLDGGTVKIAPSGFCWR
jgi:hypothetical protein